MDFGSRLKLAADLEEKSDKNPDKVNQNTVKILLSIAHEAIVYLRSIPREIANLAYQSSKSQLYQKERENLSDSFYEEYCEKLDFRPHLDTLDERILRLEKMLKGLEQDFRKRRKRPCETYIGLTGSMLGEIREMAQKAYDILTSK